MLAAPPFERGGREENHPVVNVSWLDATAYCEWIGGRLPTEAEWEYAARGGRKGSRFPNGNELTKRDAQFEADGTAPVDQNAANDYGLHDMVGNVWEWVADWYEREYYKRSPQTDPKGPDKGDTRVVRGGAWLSKLDSLRVSDRERFPPVGGNVYVGFRCVREVIS